MKILIHSTAPWFNSGYGGQTALLAPRLTELGHEVAISAICGLEGAPRVWRGMTVYPRRLDSYGSNLVRGHADHFSADLVLTLCDIWPLRPEVFADLNTACWFPVDCHPLSIADRPWLQRTKAVPIAMSRHGHQMLLEAGFDAAQYVPHGIDTATYAPGDQAEAREILGVPGDAFVIGINSANKGTSPSRKAFPQQLAAFAKLRKRHSDALLMIHTEMTAPDGLDLPALGVETGIPREAIVWSDQYLYRAGMFSDKYLAAWYNACDVVSNATYGEGFGLPTVEAQACGVPVVVTDNSASAELVGSGWKIPGVEHWHHFHQAWWSAPDVDHLARTYAKAYAGGAVKRRGGQARDFAVGYDADRVLKEYWVPALDVFAAAVEDKTA